MYLSLCGHVYDVALCGSRVRNVDLDLWLVGQPWAKQKRMKGSPINCKSQSLLRNLTSDEQLQYPLRQISSSSNFDTHTGHTRQCATRIQLLLFVCRAFKPSKASGIPYIDTLTDTKQGSSTYTTTGIEKCERNQLAKKECIACRTSSQQHSYLDYFLASHVRGNSYGYSGQGSAKLRGNTCLCVRYFISMKSPWGPTKERPLVIRSQQTECLGDTLKVQSITVKPLKWNEPGDN